MYYWFNPCCFTVLLIARMSIIKSLQCSKDFFQVTKGICFTVTKMIRWDSALWTGSILATCAKKLLRIVTDTTCQEGVTSVDIAIAEAHFNTTDPSRFKGLGVIAHDNHDHFTLFFSFFFYSFSLLTHLLTHTFVYFFLLTLLKPTNEHRTRLDSTVPSTTRVIYWSRLPS